MSLKKKPIEEIKTEAAKNAIIKLHKKFGKTISVNSCFGSSNIGQMSGFISREIVKDIPNAFMRCPIAIHPEVEGPVQVLLHDDYQVVIDGCKARCLAKSIEKAGIKVDLSYAIDEDFGVPKESTIEFDNDKMKEITDKIINDIKEKIIKTNKEAAISVAYEIKGDIIENNFFMKLINEFKNENVDIVDIHIQNTSLMGFWATHEPTVATFRIVSTMLKDLKEQEKKIEKLIKETGLILVEKKK